MTRSRTLYRSILENISDGYALLKMPAVPPGALLNYVFLEVNSAFAELAGISRESVMGKTVTELFPPAADKTAGWGDKFRDALLSGQLPEFEVTLEAEGRSYRVFAFSPVEGYLVILFQDNNPALDSVRFLEKYNRLLSAREDRVLELKSTVNDLLHELGRETRFRTTARTDEEMRYITQLYESSLAGTGVKEPVLYSLDESVGRRLEEIMLHLMELVDGSRSPQRDTAGPDACASLLQKILQSLREAREILSQQVKDTEHSFKLKAAELEKSRNLAFNIMEDAEEARKEAEAKTEKINRHAAEMEFKNLQLEDARKEAEDADRTRSQFLSNMSHEIRTPMNVILGFSDLLAGTVSEKKQKEYLDAIRNAGNNLLHLIDEILDYSRIEAGKLELHYEAVDIRSLFNDLRQMFEKKIKEKNLEFIVDVNKKLPPPLLLAGNRLRQAVYNLLDNALKFTDTGYIKITCRIRRGDAGSGKEPETVDLSITVEDTGPGIPQSLVKDIFDAFKQQDGQSTRKHGGTGLGLAIARRLVEMMNGTISVRSTPGSGSVFEVLLRGVKIASDEAAVSPADETGEGVDLTGISFHGQRVLVVDDIRSNRLLIKSWLVKLNLEVMEAGNGLQAVERVDEARPQFILMDLVMPEMDGCEAAQEIRKREAEVRGEEKDRHIPIYALTGRARDSVEAKMAECGFDGYICKPVDLKTLISQLARFLDYTVPVEARQEKPPLPPEAGKISETGDGEYFDVRTIKDLPGMVDVLENELLPLCKGMEEAVDMEEVENFAARLKELAQSHHASHLLTFACNLDEYTRNFDITNIDKTLKQFPRIIEKLLEIKETADE